MRHFGGEKRFEGARNGWEEDSGVESTAMCPCYRLSVNPTEASGDRGYTSNGMSGHTQSYFGARSWHLCIEHKNFSCTVRSEEKLTDPGHHKEGDLRDTLYHQDRYQLSREDTSLGGTEELHKQGCHQIGRSCMCTGHGWEWERHLLWPLGLSERGILHRAEVLTVQVKEPRSVKLSD